MSTPTMKQHDILSYQDYLSRVHTYTPMRWLNKPNELSPLIISLYGYICVNIDCIQCVQCGHKYIVRVDYTTYDTTTTLNIIYNNIITKLQTTVHHKFCGWNNNPSPIKYAQYTTINELTLVQQLKQCIQSYSIVGNDTLPAIDASVVDTIQTMIQQQITQRYNTIDHVVISLIDILSVLGWEYIEQPQALQCTICGVQHNLRRSHKRSRTDCHVIEPPHTSITTYSNNRNHTHNIRTQSVSHSIPQLDGAGESSDNESDDGGSQGSHEDPIEIGSSSDDDTTNHTDNTQSIHNEPPSFFARQASNNTQQHESTTTKYYNSDSGMDDDGFDIASDDINNVNDYDENIANQYHSELDDDVDGPLSDDDVSSDSDALDYGESHQSHIRDNITNNNNDIDRESPTLIDNSQPGYDATPEHSVDDILNQDDAQFGSDDKVDSANNATNNKSQIIHSIAHHSLQLPDIPDILQSISSHASSPLPLPAIKQATNYQSSSIFYTPSAGEYVSVSSQYTVSTTTTTTLPPFTSHLELQHIDESVEQDNNNNSPPPNITSTSTDTKSNTTTSDNEATDDMALVSDYDTPNEHVAVISSDINDSFEEQRAAEQYSHTNTSSHNNTIHTSTTLSHHHSTAVTDILSVDLKISPGKRIFLFGEDMSEVQVEINVSDDNYHQQHGVTSDHDNQNVMISDTVDDEYVMVDHSHIQSITNTHNNTESPPSLLEPVNHIHEFIAQLQSTNTITFNPTQLHRPYCVYSSHRVKLPDAVKLNIELYVNHIFLLTHNEDIVDD